MKRTFNAMLDLGSSAALVAALTGAVFILMRLLDEACELARPHMIGPTLTHTACILLGIALLYVCQVLRSWSRERSLPPATARQLARARRANRLAVRAPPRWIPLPDDHFSDSEQTR